MARYSQPKIRLLLRQSDTAASADEKGEKLETLTRYLFEKVRSMSFFDRNVIDQPRAHELDLVFSNTQDSTALRFLDPVVFIECKNTADRVGSQAVGWFVRKLQDRGATSGILIALSGITGAADGVSNAHSEVLTALVRDRIKILILSRDEILNLQTTDDLVDSLLQKYLQLAVYKTVA
jgi:hypothetical protein